MSQLTPRDGFVRLGDAARDGWQFHYREWGSPAADPLVLLHGFSEQARSYDTLAADLADRFRVLALDQRGHGETDWTDNYRWQTFVDDIGQFVEALGLGPTTLVGHSMGGTFGALYAAQHPELVSRLVVIDQAPGAELRPDALEKLVPIIMRPAFESPEELIGLLQAAVPRYREAELRRTAPHLLRQRDDGRWVWRFDPAMLSPETGAQLPGTDDLLTIWREIRCPTLLVRGADSENLPRDVAERALAVLKDGHQVVIPNSGHYLPWENPEGLRAAIRGFLLEE